MNAQPTAPSFDPPLPVDVFLESSVNTYIYDDLRQFECAFLNYLIEREYVPGKPVAFFARSSDELVFIIASCWRLGIPFVPVNPDLPVKDQVSLLKQLNVDFLIGNQQVDSFHQSLNVLPMDRFTLSRILTPDFTPGERVAEHKKRLRPEQIFGYLCTSGTTGKPKIVPLKRRQMFYAARASTQNLKLQRNRLWLLSLPLHHIGGISVILRSLLYGSGVYRVDKFDVSGTIDLLKQHHRVEATSLVPTMLERLIKHPGFSVHSHFQAVLLGGGPIAPSLVEDCLTRGIPVIASYGMTESCAQITANPLMTAGDLSRPRESAGRIFAPNSIAVRKEDGTSAEAFETGHLWLKGPQLFDGYFNRNRADCFDAEGWFNTGDFGYLNERGELFVAARRTDLIISGGENISPVEIEEALTKLQGVRDAAVVGIPDKEWGQKVMGVVVTAVDGNADAGTEPLRQQLRKTLPSFKIPKVIRRVDAIPRTGTGKIIRSKVKALFSR